MRCELRQLLRGRATLLAACGKIAPPALPLLALMAEPVAALSDADMDAIVTVFEEQCLAPLMRGDVPSDDGFRLPEGEAGFGYSGSVTRDDKVMLQVYEQRGLWGCGTENSVYTVPAEGADYNRLVAVLDGFSDKLAQGDFAEVTDCLTAIDGSWARSFVSTGAARPGTYVKVLVSATRSYHNGGPSLQEHYGTPLTECEAAR